MPRVPSLLFVAAIGVAAAAACRKAPAPPAQSAPTTASNPAASPSAPPPAKPLPATLPAVVAKVNGESIEKWELESAVRSVEARAGQPIPSDRRDAAYRDILNQIIDYHVLVQQTKALKLDVSDADVTARLAQVRQQFQTEDAFKTALQSEGLTLDQLQQQTRMSLEAQKIVETQITPSIAVQDADIDTFYKQNLARFKQDEAVHAAHILIGLGPTADPAAKKSARGRAEAVLRQLRGGADFAKVAREQSQDPGSAPNGGDLGFFQKGQMDPAFEAAAFATKPGAMSGIVESQFGFHVIKVIERRPARTAPLAEVSGQIKEFLAGEQRRQKLDGFVQQARAKSKIEILV